MVAKGEILVVIVTKPPDLSSTAEEAVASSLFMPLPPRSENPGHTSGIVSLFHSLGPDIEKDISRYQCEVVTCGICNRQSEPDPIFKVG